MPWLYIIGGLQSGFPLLRQNELVKGTATELLDNKKRQLLRFTFVQFNRDGDYQNKQRR